VRSPAARPATGPERRSLTLDRHPLTAVKTQEGPRWDRITPVNDPPRARTGHVCVTFQDRILLFGGTDGEFHYNDTWSYHIPTREWTELECIGYLPVAREGHAATVVGDVVYIFGGRDVNGQDLGDLAAFKISSGSFPLTFPGACRLLKSPILITLPAQLSAGSCSRTWVRRPALAAGMRWPATLIRSSSSAARRSTARLTTRP